ncbi:hypothetical protein ACROYT_G033112 [Oculina patagonica]
MAASFGLPVSKDQKSSKSSSKKPTSKHVISFELVKEKLLKGRVEHLDCEELSSYCSKLQLKTSGTKGELIERLAPLKDENLFDKRVSQITKQYKFRTSLSRENVPPPTAGWKFDTALFPKIKQENIDAYQSAKRQGKKGQYRKALRMFQSRRMKSIKVLKRGDTEKLQTWHHPNTRKKDSAKVKTASHIRLKYFRNARSARKTVMHERTKKKLQMRQGDGSNVDKSDWLSRDVSKISSKVENRLNETSVNVSNHFFKTLTKYKIQSGLYFHLSYQNAYLCRLINYEHDYAKHTVTYDDTILAPRFADKAEDVWHSVLDPAKGKESVSQPSTSFGAHSSESVFSEEKTKELLNLISHSTEELITVKIPECESVKLCGSNYVDVIQGSKEWFNNRIGIITASKIPALLGLCGHKEFDSSWFCIHNKLDESLHKPKKFKNFERGKTYERAALDSFSKVSGIPILNCGFFKHPTDANYGASPDGITQTFSVEVKTRAENSTAPLEKVTGSHVVQTNFQMSCTGGQITFLQSYLPEKDVSNFFYIARNDLLINVIKDITDHILHNEVFVEWHYDEHPHLCKLGEELLGSIATFERLRYLRSWINVLAKDVKKVAFV